MSSGRLLLLMFIASFGAPASWAQGVFYVGCGTLTDDVSCGGCVGNTGGCSCIGGFCTSSTVECVALPVGWNLCATGATCKKIYSDTTRCKRRLSCNNSLGIDLGNCASDHYCVTTQPFIWWGDSRTTYEATINCIG